MKTPLEKQLEKVYQIFNRDHEHLRESLMASLPDRMPAKTIYIRKFIGETIMRSRITKLAAAAVIIIGVLIGIHQFSNSMEKVAFADVVKPILTARTATYKITLKIGNKTGNGFRIIEGDGMFMEPGHMRDTMEAGGVRIEDIQKGKILLLNPEKKTATVFELKNINDEEKRQAEIFSEIRRLIQQAQQTGNESVEFLGKQTIDGQSAIGYRVRLGEEFIVWANAETLLPIRMEYSMTKKMGFEFTYTFSDFTFNVELDESLFSLEIPEGYTVDTVQMDVSEPKEKELHETFRLWTDVFGGKFPPDLNMKMAMKVAAGIMEADAVKAGFKKGMDPSDPKFQEAKEGFETARRGIIFVNTLPESSDWHYAGKDATFGDANTPIFWYRPEGSTTYRVIYADLSVKNVAPENLPKQK